MTFNIIAQCTNNYVNISIRTPRPVFQFIKINNTINFIKMGDIEINVEAKAIYMNAVGHLMSNLS